MEEKIKNYKKIVNKIENLKVNVSTESFNDFSKRLPEVYFHNSDIDDIVIDFENLPEILEEKKYSVEYDSDIEKFSLMKNQYDLVIKTFINFYQANIESPKLFRLYRDIKNEFVVLGIYNKLNLSERKDEYPLHEPKWDNLELVKDIKSEKRLVFNNFRKEKTEITIEIKNVSFKTVIKNLLETLEGYEYSYIQIWMTKEFNHFKSLYAITIQFYNILKEEIVLSLEKDFERYLQTYISTRSLFDIVGPSMIGPSSSHTAGANRIGQIARQFFISLLKINVISKIDNIKIKLIGSFRDTGVGHNTPEAIIGGLCGYDTDDDQMISEGKKALNSISNYKFEFNEISSDFSGFLKGEQSDDEKYLKEKNNNIAEIIASIDSKEITITGFSIGGGNVEIRYINGQKIKNGVIDGKNSVFLNYEKIELASQEANGILIESIYKESISKLIQEQKEFPFNSFEEMIESISPETSGTKLSDKILDLEEKISGISIADSLTKLKKYWDIMKESIVKGLSSSDLSKFQLTGQDSVKLKYYLDRPTRILSGDSLYTKALKYAIAVNETNAINGLIVACPTGGSCGILPGILKAWDEIRLDIEKNKKEEKIIRSMAIAGFLGMILFDDVPTAGADLGCQAEIGGGAAMAAAALTYLENGSLKKIIEAFTLALKNSMGLVCDPIAGLVEIPCVKRNGVYSSLAISSAIMALAGIKSIVSPDEVVLALKEVGERMDDDYKETARAGLAMTRDGKKIERKLHKACQSLFN